MIRLMEKLLYPGTFDPPTYGHLDIVKRGAGLCDNLIIAVAADGHKTPLFSVKERVFIFKELVKTVPNVEVKPFSGLLVNFAQENNCTTILRGLRTFSDFEYEFQMALANRKLLDIIETIFIMPSEEYAVASSGLVREIIWLGGDAGRFVPEFIETLVRKKFKSEEH